MKTDDRGVIEMIQENPYMQIFLVLEAFTYEQVMTPSLLLSIKKRVDLNLFESLTDDLIRKGLKLGVLDIRIINEMLDSIKHKPIPFDRRQLKYFFVIQHLLELQETMYKKKSHQVEDRIVNIHQPHVRPVVRGKAKAKTEFGAKINTSLLDGYARVDHFDWDAFNEGKDPQARVERFRKLNGKYPELLQMDKIYLTRENRWFLKDKGIRYTGEPLGRKPVKEIKSRYQKRKERREAAERNQVDGKFGQGKREYGLNDIRVRLSSTSNSWIGSIIFAMSLIRHMRDIPLSYNVSLLLNLMKARDINIYPLGSQIKFCA